MRISLGAFGALRKHLPDYREEVEADLPEGSVVTDLLALFGVDLDEIGLITVNGQMASETACLTAGDRVEIFSPMEGGGFLV